MAAKIICTVCKAPKRPAEMINKKSCKACFNKRTPDKKVKGKK